LLSSRQLELLQALINRIIPPDQDLGGWEAGVGDYLLRQFGCDLKQVIPIYILGLESLDAEALAIYHTKFDGLSDSLQDDLLVNVEASKVNTTWKVNPIEFFRMATEHCAEGYYSDTDNGGNKDYSSWKMMGFEVSR
jgi:hypothetical protein